MVEKVRTLSSLARTNEFVVLIRLEFVFNDSPLWEALYRVAVADH